MRCKTVMFGVEVSGREPRASNGPAPTLTISAVYRRRRWPAIVVGSVLILVSFAIRRSGSNCDAADAVDVAARTASVRNRVSDRAFPFACLIGALSRSHALPHRNVLLVATVRNMALGT